MISIKKIIVFLALIGLVLFSGYIYVNNNILNAKSDLDKKTALQQREELLINEAYKDFPEIIALREQLATIQASASNNSEQTETEQRSPSDAANDDAGGGNETSTNPGVPSQKQIETNLINRLTSLEEEYNRNLRGLINSAKEEYNKAQSGQKKISNTELAKKFINMAEKMEAECDARVYAVIVSAEVELEKYNYSTAITDQARKEYQETKKERRKQLLNNI